MDRRPAAAGPENHQFRSTAPPGLGLDVLPLLLAHQPDRVLDQFADHALDIPPVIAHLGVLRGLDLDKGCPVSLARRRAISVLPTPVGPIIMMFLRRHFAEHVIDQVACANGFVLL